MRNFDNILTTFQENVYQAMLDDLAGHLGVSAESLSRLGLGWVPVAQFKKGPNFQGWWAIPERDAAGVPVGLSLRSKSDFKVMYPGSKHGLVYPLNPYHEQGRKSYRRGAHNWVRTMDAGVECPVCGKPDGCLLSADDPDDPAAVICIRVRENAARPQNFGYLHILKAEGHVQSNSSALLDSRDPIIIVEGMTDAATVLDMGLVAVGRPSNLACLNMLSDLVRGRPAIIVGENDQVNPLTGQRPGWEGMTAAYQTLKHVCRSAKMVLPPEEFKDLRQWRLNTKLTREEFLDYVEQHATSPSEDLILPDDSPLTIANAWLASSHRLAGRLVLRFHAGRWFRYEGTKYEEIDELVDIKAKLHGWAANKIITVLKDNGEEQHRPLRCTRRVTADVLEALACPCPLNVSRTPAWINDADGPTPTDLIPFENGLLHLPSYLAGADESEYLLPHTPDFFTTFCLPFPFDPTAKCPTWQKFLLTSLGDEMAKIHLLQQWFGYNLAQDTSLHKFMMFRGVKRSGKGTAMAALEAIIGEENVGSTSLKQLTERFGFESLLGKQAIFMGDARLPKTGDSMRALEILLNIVGEDPVYVDRKNKTPVSNYRFPARFTIATNLLPDLPDHAGALEARLLILDFERCFAGREDFTLRDRIIAEAPGIAVWALQGLKKLRETNRFITPQSSTAAMSEWREITSPVAAFLEACCVQAPKDCIPKAELYGAWEIWANRRKIDPGNQSQFLERVKHNMPFTTSKTVDINGRRQSAFVGLQLTREAARQLTSRPQ
jgi:putative DNA primase/helicase